MIHFFIKTVNVIVPDPSIFFGIAASVADATAVNSNGTKALLGIHFLLKVNQFLSSL